MKSPNQRSTPTVEELEVTAELPVLPGAAAFEPEHDVTAVMPLGDSVSGRGPLETNLRSLTDSLRTLEEKLRSKSDELTVFEREVGARDRRIGDLDRELAQQSRVLEQSNATNAVLLEGVGQLTARLASAEQARDQHAAAHSAIAQERAAREQALGHASARLTEFASRAERHHEVLLSAEGTRQIYEGMVAEREQQIDALQERIALVEKDAMVRAEQVAMREQALQSASDAQRNRADQAEQLLEQARGRIDDLERAAQQSALAMTQLKDSTAARVSALESELADATRRAVAREQTLQSGMEVQTGRATELERELSQAKARIETLERDGQQLRATSEARQQSADESIRGLEQAIAAAAEQASQRQQELGDKLAAEQKLVAEQTGSINELRREYAAAQSQLADASQSVARLEDELHDHMELIQALQQQLNDARQRAETTASDLAAAEERIRTAQNELRQRDVRIERLGTIEAELREQLQQITRSLEERNALIGRLEGEAASSAAVLGNIQHNLERLGTEAATQTGVTVGTPSGGEQTARLLVRTEGDTGIVHVLGRKTTIGRTPDNDLRIDADYISRHHAVILTGNNSTVIEDLNSTNGVYVNGTRVSRRALAEGDLVTIGQTEFRFVLKPVPDRSS
jgi:chromosome segregation ATPase